MEKPTPIKTIKLDKPEVLGWAEGRDRWGDSTRMAHLIVVKERMESGTGLSSTACGAKSSVYGCVSKAPRDGVQKCQRCERTEKHTPVPQA